MDKYNIPKNLKIIETFSGHIPSRGKSAGQILNPYWLCLDKNIQSEPFYVMFCKLNTFCYFSNCSLEKLIDNKKT